MKKYLLPLVMISLALLVSCGESVKTQTTALEAETNASQRAKFEPADGEVILFAGQEQEAIGGVEGYEDGYFNHFDAPGGFTMYTNLCPDDTMFGNVLKGLDGVFTTDKWGDFPSNMTQQLEDEDFRHSALAIGLWLVNHDEEIAEGGQDSLIEVMGNWLKSLGRRPVFLRIGYEFSGAWNHYDREAFLKSYRRIKDKLDAMEVTNVAYVWQSHGWEEPDSLLEAWYPGDEYVDWCAYSFFSRWDEANMIDFARKKGKPVFIAEATPTISTETTRTNGKTKEIILGNPAQAEEAWEKWFIPFFKTINDNPDVVKAVSYINCHWKSHPMWVDNPSFQDVDARLQTSEMISEKWREETSKEKYLKADPGLFDKLWN